MYAGYDTITPDAGTVEKANCITCNAEMTVERNVKGYRSFTCALAKKESIFDRFTCPNHDKDWHKQVVQLKIKIFNEVSAKIKKFLQEEIDEILSHEAI